MTESPEFAALDALSTEELRERAFHVAREHLDVRLLLGRACATCRTPRPRRAWRRVQRGRRDHRQAFALFREFEGHDFGDDEPLLRAKFIDYLLKHNAAK